MANNNNWQLQVLNKVLAEEEANARLKRRDPAAYEAKMLAQLPTSKCCLCGETFKGYGHNAFPVRDEGAACDECNSKIVVPQCILKWTAREP
jgi:DNA-directed RNA polymerase subunit RPC12/RpoP